MVYLTKVVIDIHYPDPKAPPLKQLPPLRGSETLRGLVLIIGEAISLPRAIDEGIKV